MKKGNKLYSILTGACPRCHQENMYMETNPYQLGSVYDMHDTCSFCKLKYKMEPSFFFGAMYVSYGLGVACGVSVFIFSYLLLGTSLVTSFIAIATILVVLMPIIMRLARNIWIDFFIDYNDSVMK